MFLWHDTDVSEISNGIMQHLDMGNPPALYMCSQLFLRTGWLIGFRSAATTQLFKQADEVFSEHSKWPREETVLKNIFSKAQCMSEDKDLFPKGIQWPPEVNSLALL